MDRRIAQLCDEARARSDARALEQQRIREEQEREPEEVRKARAKARKLEMERETDRIVSRYEKRYGLIEQMYYDARLRIKPNLSCEILEHHATLYGGIE